jgi:hypothetical protein
MFFRNFNDRVKGGIPDLTLSPPEVNLRRARSIQLVDSCDVAYATSVASRDTKTFLPARRTLTLEKFKHAFESWR